LRQKDVLKLVYFIYFSFLIGETLEKLGSECKELLISFYYKKMSIKEIAERMNYATAAAKIKKKRCMEAVKNQFEDLKI